MVKIEGKWVVAVSGGPDSMALLNMCYENKMDIIVAHVNYNVRSTAERDEKGVAEYCKERGIPFFKHFVHMYSGGNFEAEAREIRYKFFSSLIREHQCDGVLVAHHLDDVIETYLMQTSRNSIPNYYGIRSEVMINGCLVKRMLLAYTKKELINYCDEHNVPYFIDETNNDDKYARNRIRHSIIDKMSDEDKRQIVEEIHSMNVQRKEVRKKVQDFLKNHEHLIDRDSFAKLPADLQLDVIREFIRKNAAIRDISLVNIRSLRDQFLRKQHNFRFALGDYTLFAEYGKLTIYKNREFKYTYMMTDVEEIETRFFKVRKDGKKIEGLRVEPRDLPIVIRNYHAGDKIKMRFGTKRVSRFFIDNKIPHHERNSWPVVLNKHGTVIFVCGIGCDIEHYSNNLNMFVIK